MSDYSTGSATINGTVQTSMSFSVPGSTQAWYAVTISGNGSVQNAATVTAGKTAWVYGLASHATGVSQLYANDGTTVLASVPTNSTFVSPFPIGKFAAGEVIKVANSPGTKITVYYLEV